MDEDDDDDDDDGVDEDGDDGEVMKARNQHIHIQACA